VKEGEHLVWIRKDLWSAKSFNPTGCYPVGEEDYWSEAPSKLCFAEVFWGDEKKASFWPGGEGSNGRTGKRKRAATTC
jgi:hypothetical protein